MLEGGVQIVHQINDASSEHEFSLDLKLEKNQNLIKSSTNEYLIIDEDGNTVSLIGSPWAVDSKGKFLPTEYIIDGNTLTQVVHVEDIDISYPIKADPLFCSKMIESVKWNAGYDINKNDNAGSLGVIPNTCARNYIAASYVATINNKVLGLYSTSTLIKKMWSEVTASSNYKNKISSKTSNRVFDQFVCHAWNPAATYNQKSWDLEPKRKDLSLWSTYLAKCNPAKE